MTQEEMQRRYNALAAQSDEHNGDVPASDLEERIRLLYALDDEDMTQVDADLWIFPVRSVRDRKVGTSILSPRIPDEDM